MSKTNDENFKLGPMNHVGVAVPDIEAAIAFYRDVMGVTEITEPEILAPQGVKFAFVNLPTGPRGMRVLSEPRIGAHGTPVVFLHPSDSGGVLIELMESHKDH